MKGTDTFSLLYMLTETISEMVMVCSIDGIVLRVNSKFSKNLNWSQEKVEGKNLDFFFPSLFGSSSHFSDTQPLNALSVLKMGEIETLVLLEDGSSKKVFFQMNSMSKRDVPDYQGEPFLLCSLSLFKESSTSSASSAFYEPTASNPYYQSITIQESAVYVDKTPEVEEFASYRRALKAGREGLWDWDLVKGELFYSPEWEEMIGYREGELKRVPQEWFARIHPDDIEEHRMKISEHLKSNTSFFENEYRLRHKNGDYRWVRARGKSFQSSEGKVIRMAGLQIDINLYKELEQKSQYDVLHDKLTGLPNRALFLDRLERGWVRARHSESSVMAVLVFDLDRFKNINDSLGHAVGDQMLYEVARRMERALPPAYSVARLGGDEFAILLEDVTDGEAPTQVAEKVKRELARPFFLGGQEVFIKASVGIALSNRDYKYPDELLRDADAALNRAKTEGKDRYAFFVTEIRLQALSMLQMESDLRRALERKELEVYYQPIVCLKTGSLHGFEALVRWFKADGTSVSPAHFIPVAEETGMIIQLGHWVLEKACKQLFRWRSKYDGIDELVISVNLSSKQFAHRTLLDDITQVIKKTGVPGRVLKLEITESLIMDNIKSVADTLHRLKDMDIRLSIDDFGTGYSSLSYLHQLPFDTLKIDRSFVGNVDKGEKHAKIVRTIVDLARNLGMGVIAEGIETEEHLSFLQSLECDYAQGYFFSRAVTAKKAERLLRKAMIGKGNICPV